MKVLVTGATGFVGGKLIDALVRIGLGGGEEIHGVTRGDPANFDPRLKWTRADLSQRGWTTCLPSENFEIVVHFAQSRKYREFPEQADDIFNLNAQATFELANWALRHGVKRFLFASTGNVYGFGDRTCKESDVCLTDSMYGASKLAAETILRPFAQHFDITILRFFGIYGPDQANMLVPDLIQRFLKGEEIVLDGNLGVKFNPIYISDAVEAVIRLITENLLPGYEIINVGGPEVVDLRQLVIQLERFSGLSAKTRITESTPKCLVGSTEKMSSLVNWNAKVSFSEGLFLTYKSLHSNAEEV